ncbi:hypothetical protein CISIN_1g0376411mg, partial [Citrus sinensis]
MQTIAQFELQMRNN